MFSIKPRTIACSYAAEGPCTSRSPDLNFAMSSREHLILSEGISIHGNFSNASNYSLPVQILSIVQDKMIITYSISLVTDKIGIRKKRYT
jgi:hypothetical protein